MSSWVGNPGRPPYVIPRGSAGLKKNSFLKASGLPLFSIQQAQNRRLQLDNMTSRILIIFHYLLCSVARLRNYGTNRKKEREKISRIHSIRIWLSVQKHAQNLSLPEGKNKKV